MRERELLVVAGEASGDLHAARLLTELRRRRPALRAFGMGGEELAAAGCERLADASELSVVGITEAVSVLGRAREVFAQLLAAAQRRRPAAAVLVDFPEFNLRLARRLKALGIPVVYYVSPQVWAWRRHRVRQVRRDVDRMLVLFGFEAEFYARHGVAARHVGHPLVDEVPELPQAWQSGAPSGPYRVALLPGSRRSEIEALLPEMLHAVAALARRRPIWPRLILANSVSRSSVEEIMTRVGVAADVVEERRWPAIADSHLALCASGTATLEVGLLGTPMIVLYRLTSGSYWLGRLLVRLPHFSLVNLVLDEAAVPELLQRDADGPAVARLADELLGDAPAIAAMRARLACLRGRLGEPGASGRAADAIVELLDERSVE